MTMGSDYDGPAQSRAYRLLRVGSILLPLVGILLWGVTSYRAEVRLAHAHAASNAELVQQYVTRLIETQTTIHSAARERVRREGLAFLSSEAFHLFLAGIEADQPSMHALDVMTTDGNWLASSSVFPVPAQPGQVEFLTAIAGGADLLVDRIRLAPNNDDAFVVATPLTVAGVKTVIVSSLAADTVGSFLRNVAARPGEAASLMRDDGKLLMRNFDAEPVMLPDTAPGRTATAGKESGLFTTIAVTDGVERTYAFTRLGPLPLIANFGVSTQGITTNWLWNIAPVWALFAVTGLFSFLTAERMRRGLLTRFEADSNRKRLDAAERLADERIRLMRETNHRVKNNLSLVVSLINMQVRGTKGIDAEALKGRINAISQVHDLMHQSADGVTVDFGEILKKVAASPALVPTERGLTVAFDVAPGIMLGPDRTTPLALIAAELLTNAVKHAFPGNAKGTIQIRLARDAEAVLFEVLDDGIGFSGDGARNSGSAIVDALVRQIGGTVERWSDHGACIRIRFAAEQAG
ncbi:MAG: histidine kinase dimerization/phosphoacceptor domain -containing protein [Pseudomonadota bacterium]